ncbi:hypothetical protein GCM10011586_04060 [Silvibacterium dinghuense]|nr:hypothetical protein GCM10011586_04060 [Silvibacterium dinghuense]
MVWLLLVMAALCIGRAAVSQNTNYIDLGDYAHYQAKQPFQSRLLMVPVLRAAEGSHGFAQVYDTLFRKTVDSPADLAVMLTDSLCLLLLLWATAALRRGFTPEARTSWLAPLVMLLVMALTYVVRYEQRFTMPYDFLSVLLYTVGLVAIVRRQGWLLLLVLLAGIPNRETAVFLVPVWMWLEWRDGRKASAAVYGLLGLVIAIGWRLWIAHFLHTGQAQYEWPFRNNLTSMFVPVHWPQLLSVFGYLALPMWMLRREVRDERLRAMWVATVPFLAAALIVGVWRETRIFGELSALVAVTFAIQLEQKLRAA